MAARTYTETQRERARELYLEHGPAEAARQLAEQGIDVAPDTISRWANRYGWVTERESNARAATEASRLSYEQRRSRLVEKAGERAEHFLDRAGSVQDARSVFNLMRSFSVAIDKAELLSGRATSRSEVGSIDDAQRRLRELRDQARDELAAKRAQRAGTA